MAGRYRALPVLLVLGSICSPSPAAPRLTVSVGGQNAHGHIEWRVQAAADPALFMDTPGGFGGSLDVELGLEVTSGSLVQASFGSAWHEIPAFNPFTGGVTVGVHSNLESSVVFASLGSDVLTSGGLVDLLTIETAPNSATTLRWGGHTHWPGLPFQFVGGRITQAGMNFDRIQGSRTWSPGLPGDFNASGLVEQGDLDLVLTRWGQSANPPPAGWVANLPSGIIDQDELDPVLANWGRSATAVIPGDYDGSGLVEQADLDFVLTGWGRSADPPPAGWVADLPSGIIDQDELDRLLANWGRSAPAVAITAAQSIPEPTTALLLAACGLVTLFSRRRGRN